MKRIEVIEQPIEQAIKQTKKICEPNTFDTFLYSHSNLQVQEITYDDN